MNNPMNLDTNYPQPIALMIIFLKFVNSLKRFGLTCEKITQFLSSNEKKENTNEPRQSDCAPTEDSGQSGHPPSLIRVFAVRLMGSQGPKLSSCRQRSL